jgi:hypothetical protein
LNAHATSNTMLPLTHVPTVPMANWEMPPLEDAKDLLLTAMLVEESNWANNNAINAETAQQDKSLLETHAKTELYVLVINNSTLQLTLVKTVQMANWEMPLLEDAKPLQLDVMQEEESNWANNNAISAETAQSDKYM